MPGKYGLSMVVVVLGVNFGCVTTSITTNKPQEKVSSPVVTDCDGMTVTQLEECIHDCVRSQYDHPEETPYDCRLMCCTGEMR